MHGGYHLIIGRRGWSGLDMDNHMRGRGGTGLGEMHLVAGPLHRTLRAVSGFGIIGGSEEFRRGRQVFDLAPAQRAINLTLLLDSRVAEFEDVVY
jgi:hypothetical protein